MGSEIVKFVARHLVPVPVWARVTSRIVLAVGRAFAHPLNHPTLYIAWRAEFSVHRHPLSFIAQRTVEPTPRQSINSAFYKKVMDEWDRMDTVLLESLALWRGTRYGVVVDLDIGRD